MEVFIKVSSGVMIAIILILAIPPDRKEFGLLLSMTACVAVGMIAISYLKPVISFVKQLQAVGNIDSEALKILLKSVGIGIIGEIAVMICNDSGNGSLGKALQYLSATMILWLSLPLFTSLLNLLQRMLGKV